MKHTRLAILALSVLALGTWLACRPRSKARPSLRPEAHISVLGVHPDPSSAARPRGAVTVFVSYSITDFQPSLSPYTVSLQFQTDEGLTIGPAFGPANAVISQPSGQVRLVVTIDEVYRKAAPQHISSPLTMLVIVDHAVDGGTQIIGKSKPIVFGFPSVA